MERIKTMTKSEALELIDAYEADPDAAQICDNLCTVLDGLPGQPEGEFSADEIREMVEAELTDETGQELAAKDEKEQAGAFDEHVGPSRDGGRYFGGFASGDDEQVPDAR
jgi:hypothetical protein